MKTMAQAITEGLMAIMDKNENLVLLGAEAYEGGLFGLTEGFLRKFGPERVLEPGGGETGLLHFAAGLAMSGLYPLVALDTVDELYAGVSALSLWNQGLLRCAVSEQNAEAAEALLSVLPNLSIMTLTHANSFAAHLEQALQSGQPTVFLEPQELYHQAVQNLEATTAMASTTIVHQEGQDATILCWGNQVHTILQTARELKNEEYSIEVLELAQLQPLAEKQILESVSKTGRVLIASEGAVACRLAALIAEKSLLSLQAPVYKLPRSIEANALQDRIREAVFF